MTVEDYEKAKQLITAIKDVDARIAELESALDQDPSNWLMEIRPSPSFSKQIVKHRGLLPKFLKEIWRAETEERNRLIEELEVL